jgi:uncharacterized cupredoxin-like copper-binding protein
MRTSRIAPLALLPATALLVAGCFGGGGSKISAPKKVRPGKPIQQIDVRESEFKLDPSTISFDRPGIYRFQAINVGKQQHALRIVGPGVLVSTARIKPGQATTVDVVVVKKGSYRFFDPISNHRKKGMVGTADLK